MIIKVLETTEGEGYVVHNSFRIELFISGKGKLQFYTTTLLQKPHYYAI